MGYSFIKVIRTFSVFTLLFIFAISCEKPPGEGGASSITGKVIVREYNSDYTTIEKEYYAQEERVYIIYGDAPTHSDDERTNFDGTYRFQYLRKGTYQIYAYSKDTTGTSLSGSVPVIVTVKIDSNNEHVYADDIIIID